MVDTPTEVGHSATSDSAASPGRQRRLQWGLRSLCLLVVAVAVWTADFVNRKENAALRARVAVVSPLARELLIDDPKQVAVVRLEPMWWEDNQWDVYLPDGEYRLCVATHRVADNGLAPIVANMRLGSGRHLLSLEQQEQNDEWHISASSDGAKLVSVNEPKAWGPGDITTGGADFDRSTQLDPAKPIVLFRSQFPRGDSFSVRLAPTDGVLFWIERVAP